jgi:hypothetical protein
MDMGDDSGVVGRQYVTGFVSCDLDSGDLTVATLWLGRETGHNFRRFVG